MTDSVLSRLSYASLSQNAPLTSTQSQVDAMVSGFAEQASDWRSLAAMAAGGVFYRLGRTGTLALGTRAGVAAPLFQLGSYGIGLGAEVTAFEGTNRFLAAATGDRSNPNLWRWSGQGGWSQGLASSMVSFGMLKMGGYAAREQNVILQHLFSDLAMVGGHQATAALGLTPHQEGTFAEQLLHAEVTNLQLGAGMSLMHSVAPGLAATERALDLSLQARESLMQQNGRRRGPLFGQPTFAMAMNGGETGGETFLTPENRGLDSNHVSMSVIGDGKGTGDVLSSPTLSGDPPTTNGASGARRTIPEAEMNSARNALDILRDVGETPDTEGTVRMSQALRFARENPDAVPEALIGRNDIPHQYLNSLYRILKPEGFDILTNPNLRRTLVANRGEIALRIARGLIEQGITPIITYSESDANQSFVRRAQEMGAEVVNIGGKTADESYLRQEHLIEVAKRVNADSVHPGYGFVSENAPFAQRVYDAGLVLMGPSVETMRRAGGKSTAKEAFENAGVPVVRGTKPHTDVDRLMDAIEEQGLRYPIRLKAEEGGSGMGQATVQNAAEARARFGTLSQQALKAFGNPAILAEEYVPRFHHVEFQILADRFGNVIHLGERECTLQREGAKLVEIHPAEVFNRIPGLREKMQDAAIKAAQSVNYTGHGTVEFMVNPDTGTFYALEVNARIQVEHRVTELVSGVDIIHEQVRISRGLPLSIHQSDVTLQGAAVEVRITVPGAALITKFTVMGTTDFESLASQGIFIEPTYIEGDTPNPNTNALFAKILVTGATRREAMQRMGEVLDRTRIEGGVGLKTDLEQNRRLVKTQAALHANYDNNTVKQWNQLGGEDLSRFPYRAPTVFSGPEGVPIYLEVGGREAFERERAQAIQDALSRLLQGQESEEGLRLQGPLAEFFRQNPDARSSLGYGEEQGEEAKQQAPSANNRSVWAQSDANGDLRQVVLFENNRPRRIFLQHQALISTRETGSPIEKQSARETPLAYDMAFSASGDVIEKTRVFALRNGSLEGLTSLKSGDPYFQRSKDGNEMDLFSSPRTSGEGEKPPVGASRLVTFLNVKLTPTRSQTAVEIRDRQGDILLSVSPDQAMESPAQQILALYELTGRQSPEHIQKRSREQILRIFRNLSGLPLDNPIRQRAVEEIGSTPVSMVARLLDLIRDNPHPGERALLGEMMATREIEGFSRRHELGQYAVLDPIPSQTAKLRQATDAQDPPPSAAHFTETRENGESFDRRMIRSNASSPTDYLGTLCEAVAQLRRLQEGGPETRDNVIQLIVRRPSSEDLAQAMAQLRRMQRETEEGERSTVNRIARLMAELVKSRGAVEEEDFSTDSAYSEFMRLSLEIALRGNDHGINLKRVTFIVDQPGDYPHYFTFRRAPDAENQRTGPFVEDTRFRDLHPMLAHLIEMRRMNNFDIEHDLENSNRFSHLYYGRERVTPALRAQVEKHPSVVKAREAVETSNDAQRSKAQRTLDDTRSKVERELRDFRLFGNALVPLAQVDRNGTLEIPEVEQGFLNLAESMGRSLKARDKKDRPSWNRMFLNIQPILDVTDAEAVHYAEQLAVRHHDRLLGLGLEKVVVKARLRDLSRDEGYRTVLVRITNPTTYRYVATLDNVVRAQVREAANGPVAERDVLLKNGQYDRWVENNETVFEPNQWSPADIPIRTATPVERKELKALSRFGTWAYRIPEILRDVATRFRERFNIAPPSSSSSPKEVNGERPSVSTIPPPIDSYDPTTFVEYDLDPASMRKDQSGQLDYNQARLKPVSRPAGGNRAAVMIGIGESNLFNGEKARRVVIVGDLGANRGSLSAEECGRVNAAIKLARREGIDIDWVASSYGAKIALETGSENLDAIASTAREIILNAHTHGVRINTIIDNVNIGGMAYWIALANMIMDTGGINIYTDRGSTPLTGPDAQTVAILSKLHFLDIPLRSRQWYPNGPLSLAGYDEIHGLNGEGILRAKNLQEALDMLNLHHYYSYTSRGQFVTPRPIGAENTSERDILSIETQKGRTVGDEIRTIVNGGKGDIDAIIEAFRDPESPPALPFWRHLTDLFKGITRDRWPTVNGDEKRASGVASQQPSIRVVEEQINGVPTLVIAPPIGPLTPTDSRIFAQALRKADGRMPVLVLGSFSGFNADPLSMLMRQLSDGGAQIARSMTLHRGPIVLVNLGNLVGGSMVVVSQQIRQVEAIEQHRIVAVTGTKVQVVGGDLNANIVERSDVRDEVEAIQANIENDPRVQQARRALEGANDQNREALEKQLTIAIGNVQNELIGDRPGIYSTVVGRRAVTFNKTHSTDRAQRVGSIRAVVPADQLFGTVIREREIATRAFYLQIVQTLENPDQDPRVVAARSRLTWSTDETSETDQREVAEIQRLVAFECRQVNEDPRVVEARRAVEQGSMANLQALTRAYVRIRSRVESEVALTNLLRTAAIQMLQNPQEALSSLSQGLRTLLNEHTAARNQILQNISQFRGIVDMLEQIARAEAPSQNATTAENGSSEEPPR
ncbi:MAG: biotin carboxylase N-terminal domain-containing protein [bacterium]